VWFWVTSEPDGSEIAGTIGGHLSRRRRADLLNAWRTSYDDLSDLRQLAGTAEQQDRQSFLPVEPDEFVSRRGREPISAMIVPVDHGDEDRGPLRGTTEKVLTAAENVIYVGIAVLLVMASGVLLVLAIDELLDVFDDWGSDPIVDVLDTLLLLFIFVELLSAVRTTVAQRALIAEPFLLVGIIASIKEIVVLSVKAADDIGNGSVFRDQLWEIAVLGAVVLLLGVTAWLLRLKEREPQEAHDS
jgi:uncharacterized membrane protein (DUF373 family)